MNGQATLIGRSFASDRSGSVAMMFGLMFVALTFVAGLAIDVSRLSQVKTRFLGAADAAALAGGKAMLDGSLSEDEIAAAALKFFDENINSDGTDSMVSYAKPNVSVNKSTGGVTVTVTPQVKMTLTAVLGFDTVAVPVTSSTAFEQKDIELGLALDITGSMKGQKLADLKSAADNLIDILLPDDGAVNKARIGLAPYAAAVNLGSFAGAASDDESTDGCVWERTGTSAISDAAPGVGAYFSAGAKPKDIDLTEGKSDYSCTESKIVPITSDKIALKKSIKKLKADGYTGGHFGAQWAWNLISPNWNNIWPEAAEPVAYGSDNTLKAIILMTDGLFNTAYANGKSTDQAVSLCDAMKAEGKNVVVYAVGFQAPESAEVTLKACATSADHYFKATNGAELQQAFSAIGVQLNNLRLTN